ncbi:ROK family protein [Streptomyces lichenis]|uniref:ROK family protein n=1 Tax=Streptomyces lichenis TaxID=2306967 RepID=A0ABT0IDB7_9ACTN|nr:ROK family protein [Streptomyces lichenis]MCK8679327.1 ROK family protein [Streptomyces lichenis]
MNSTCEPSRGGDGRDAKAGKDTVRRHNLSLVLRAVYEEGEATRAAVAARVGLTRAAVSSLVEQLLAGGFLSERGKTFSGQAGRPGTALRVADTGPAGLGVEVNVDYVSVCVVDLAGTDRVRLTEHRDNRGVPPKEVLARAARMARRALEEAAGRGLRAVGARLALPGLVSGGSVRQAPNLGWDRVGAEELFAAGLGVLAVGVDNEANAAALAELWFGEAGRASGARSFVYLTGEIGVGGALVVDGSLLRGAHGFAGEIGHLVVDADGPRCRCGSRGCLERYAGQAALLRGAGIEESAGAAGVAELAARARRGEPRAVEALERAGRMLGLAVSGAVNLLDPDAVVLGGVFRPLMEWLGPAAERELAERVVSGLWAAGSGRLRASSSSGDAARGAAAVVVRGVLADPAGHAAPPLG